MGTVMVVEDDANINEVVAEYLKDAGHAVLSFARGDDALRAILGEGGTAGGEGGGGRGAAGGEGGGRGAAVGEGGGADAAGDVGLFVLDIMLPDVSGVELLRAIRKSAAHADKPVIMLTALGDEPTQLECFDGLADDYVTKPFLPRVLVRRVDALLRRSGAGQGGAAGGASDGAGQGGATGVGAACGDGSGICVDYERFEARDGGELLELTRREFELLGVLCAHVGKALSRQQLLDLAWGYGFFGDERIVDAHIKNLRKKLKGNPISTIKGVGYKLKKGGDA